ncbi:hypothetical protein Scep_015826 [Stephania cephalantha]|uniref:WRKY domain-containing protein n=1 Tax=Stephania cephalantha TaxID=152367 RepID=A0AAP0J4P5_9MAGN
MEEWMPANWFDILDEELIKGLLDNETFLSESTSISEPEADQLTDSASKHLVDSNVCNDVGLLKTFKKDGANARDALPTRISILEKGLNKMDHKYTLKIKSLGNALSDDGYKWRKYGQKSIKHSPYPRSYFRCTNPRCAAKKQVERSSSEPDTLIITYEGLHLHYTSHFFSTQTDDSLPPTKKLKNTTAEPQNTSNESKPRAHECSPTDPTQPNPTTFSSDLNSFEGASARGLLEDVVPLNILKPSIVNTISNSPSFSSSYPSSPISSSSSCLTWSPNPKFCSFDVCPTSTTTMM